MSPTYLVHAELWSVAECGTWSPVKAQFVFVVHSHILLARFPGGYFRDIDVQNGIEAARYDVHFSAK